VLFRSKYIKEETHGAELQYGFTSELFGYAMRLAVESKDKDLFEKLIPAINELKIQDGLLMARLHPDKTPDTETAEGSIWADPNQDVALALIEASEIWNTPEYTKQGFALAEAVAKSSLVKELDNGITLLYCTPEEVSASKIRGERIDIVDLSMLNFKLYEKMQEISDDPIWKKLEDSGKVLFERTLEHYELIPHRLVLVDGEVRSLNSIKNDESVLKSIPYPEHRKPFKMFVPEWNWDSFRTPNKLMDSSKPWARKIAYEIYRRVNKLGGSFTHMKAETGEKLPKGERMAASVLTMLAITAQDKGWQYALTELESLEGKEEKSSMYMNLYKGLALQQLKREIKED